MKIKFIKSESTLIPAEIKELMKDVPCHSEFFKYVSWHNHVVEMTWNEDYPSLAVYYEDYANEGGEQKEAERIAAHLETPVANLETTFPFVLKVRMYSGYFTKIHLKHSFHDVTRSFRWITL